ncbi:MAG: glycosyltransferase family 4 protein [Gemmataceae bacterium]
MNWHLITGEYPPQAGGVSDYTFLVAHALAEAGQRVTVWCPPVAGPTPGDSRVSVRRELGAIGRADLRRVDALLDAEPGPRRLLVQWVPHAYGRRALNWSFCRWVQNRAARHGDRVDVVIHEAFVAFEGSWKQRIAAVIQRFMVRTLLRNATQVWVTIPTWAELLRPYAPKNMPIAWLPVPSTIAVDFQPSAVEAIRKQLLTGATHVVGHFGTYGPHVASELTDLLGRLLVDAPTAKILLLGRNGDDFLRRFLQNHPEAAGRLVAPGRQEPAELSAHLTACDLFVQPYAGGISSRNTSLMACLAHGRVVVATAGRLTEPFWQESGAIVLIPGHDAAAVAAAVTQLLADDAARRKIAGAGASVYGSRFTAARLVQALTAAQPHS